MEKSYIYAEQLGQMHATYDAFTLVKIAHDSGVDVVETPINFYCYEFGGQGPVFWECLERLFGQVDHVNESLNAWGSSVNTYRIPLPELKSFYPLLKDEEHGRYIDKFNRMLKHSDDYCCEFETEGRMAGDCFYLTFNGEYGLYSPLLKVLVAIRNEVRELIHSRREQIVNGLQNVLLTKMVYDRLGCVVDVSMEDHVNVVFSRIMEQCGGLSLSLVAGDPFSFETMRTMLNSILEQAALKTVREEVAA
ncbi:hypothetical protein [Paenibacillus gansuensis]|uniref:Uncharacterized protein n=1 Tax=Paenibacillus gansuensis TaxID=306542 RepID=A0ABW5PHH8_9BACL